MMLQRSALSGRQRGAAGGATPLRLRHDAGHPALALLRWAGAVLASRQGARAVGGALPCAPDWLCPQAVRAIEWPLAPGSPLRLWLRDGVSARPLPRWLAPPARPGAAAPRPWPVVYGRAAPLRAQRAAPSLTCGSDIGTATALVRDRLAPQRSYLLTCAHVVAPTLAARAGDGVGLVLDRSGSAAWQGEGRLREWQPALGEGCPRSTLDAALVEVDAGTLQRLREALAGADDAWLPASIATQPAYADTPVALQRSNGSPLDGTLVSLWSGEVCVGDDDYPDYFAQEAIGYRTPTPTQPGDSGAALWTRGDALLGMHLGALDGGGSRFGANAIMARVRPVLDWFQVKPYTRFDPATITAADLMSLNVDDAAARLPATPDLPGDPVARDLLVLTQTLWGEARGEDVRGMEAVASVILNRWRANWRGAATVADVCLANAQFSCWNRDDPNRAAIVRVTASPDAEFRTAEQVARRALGLDGPPIRELPAEVRHYYAASMRHLPVWVRSTPMYERIGNHLFYAGIA